MDHIIEVLVALVCISASTISRTFFGPGSYQPYLDEDLDYSQQDDYKDPEDGADSSQLFQPDYDGSDDNFWETEAKSGKLKYESTKYEYVFGQGKSFIHGTYKGRSDLGNQHNDDSVADRHDYYDYHSQNDHNDQNIQNDHSDYHDQDDHHDQNDHYDHHEHYYHHCSHHECYSGHKNHDNKYHNHKHPGQNAGHSASYYNIQGAIKKGHVYNELKINNMEDVKPGEPGSNIVLTRIQISHNNQNGSPRSSQNNKNGSPQSSEVNQSSKNSQNDSPRSSQNNVNGSPRSSQNNANGSPLSSEVNKSSQNSQNGSPRSSQNNKNGSPQSSEVKQSSQNSQNDSPRSSQNNKNGSPQSSEVNQSSQNSQNDSSRSSQDNENDSPQSSEVNQSSQNSQNDSPRSSQDNKNDSRQSSEVNQSSQNSQNDSLRTSQNNENGSPQGSEVNQSSHNSQNVSPRWIQNSQSDSTRSSQNSKNGSPESSEVIKSSQNSQNYLPRSSDVYQSNGRTTDADSVMFPDFARGFNRPTKPPRPTPSATQPPFVTTRSTPPKPLRAILVCLRNCPVTLEYNPVCGSTNFTYNNEGGLNCARKCGVNVKLASRGPCGRPAKIVEEPAAAVKSVRHATARFKTATKHPTPTTSSTTEPSTRYTDIVNDLDKQNLSLSFIEKIFPLLI